MNALTTELHAAGYFTWHSDGVLVAVHESNGRPRQWFAGVEAVREGNDTVIFTEIRVVHAVTAQGLQIIIHVCEKQSE